MVSFGGIYYLFLVSFVLILISHLVHTLPHTRCGAVNLLVIDDLNVMRKCGGPRQWNNHSCALQGEAFTLTCLYVCALEEVCLLEVHCGIQVREENSHTRVHTRTYAHTRAHTHDNLHHVPHERNVPKHSRPASLKSSYLSEIYLFSSRFQEEVGQREGKLTQCWVSLLSLTQFSTLTVYSYFFYVRGVWF